MSFPGTKTSTPVPTATSSTTASPPTASSPATSAYPPITGEPGVDAEIKTYEELVVGLPESNLTIVDLARRLAPSTPRNSNREQLARLVRYRDLSLNLWALDNTNAQSLETQSFRCDYSVGLSASAVFLKATTTPRPDTITLVLHDQGKKAAGAPISDAVNRGHGVVAVDLLFTGDSVPQPGPPAFAQLIATTGDRPLGIEAAQLIAFAQLAQRRDTARTLRLDVTGMRSQTVALVAATLKPGLFREILVRDGIRSLRNLLDAPVTYQTAPDLFCLDLLRDFDLDHLARLAAPTRILP